MILGATESMCFVCPVRVCLDWEAVMLALRSDVSGMNDMNVTNGCAM